MVSMNWNIEYIGFQTQIKILLYESYLPVIANSKILMC